MIPTLEANCKVMYGGEWELATCISTEVDALGQNFCKVVLCDDPRVLLDVPYNEVKFLI